MQWDLIVRNAKVFDGSGRPGRQGDIAVKNGKIAALGGSSTNADNDSALSEPLHRETNRTLVLIFQVLLRDDGSILRISTN